MLFSVSRRVIVFIVLCAMAAAAWAVPLEGQEIRRAFSFSEPHVAYRDTHGRPIDEAAFLKAFRSGVGFTYGPDPGGVLAIMVLNDPAREVKAGPQIKSGEQLPSFNLKDMLGNTHATHALHGGITVVDFFFADCGGCIEEVPALNAFSRAHPEIPALAITFDLPELAARYAKHWGYTWPIVADSATFINQLHITAYPTLALVDNHGRVLAISLGYSLHAPGRKLSGDDIYRWVESYRHKA